MRRGRGVSYGADSAAICCVGSRVRTREVGSIGDGAGVVRVFGASGNLSGSVSGKKARGCDAAAGAVLPGNTESVRAFDTSLSESGWILQAHNARAARTGGAIIIVEFDQSSLGGDAGGERAKRQRIRYTDTAREGVCESHGSAFIQADDVRAGERNGSVDSRWVVDVFLTGRDVPNSVSHKASGDGDLLPGRIVEAVKQESVMAVQGGIRIHDGYRSRVRLCWVRHGSRCERH